MGPRSVPINSYVSGHITWTRQNRKFLRVTKNIPNFIGNQGDLEKLNMLDKVFWRLLPVFPVKMSGLYSGTQSKGRRSSETLGIGS